MLVSMIAVLVGMVTVVVASLVYLLAVKRVGVNYMNFRKYVIPVVVTFLTFGVLNVIMSYLVTGLADLKVIGLIAIGLITTATLLADVYYAYVVTKQKWSWSKRELLGIGSYVIPYIVILIIALVK